MSAGRYFEGVALALLCVGSLVLGARRLRSRLAPSYEGAAARIADGVLSIGLLIVVLEAVGVIGVLDRVGVVAGCLLVGALAWSSGAWGTPARHQSGGSPNAVAPGQPHEPFAASTRPLGPDRPVSPHRRLVTAVAIAGVAVVAAAWIGWTIYAYRHGMETIDTLWYHMPFAARFAQLHNIRHLQYVDGAAITVFYPANSELIHTFGLVLFGNDVLSPVIDLGWGAAALCCAWAIGRPWGREPHCLLACLPVLVTPGLVDTQPGGAYDDIVCLALLLASIALLVNVAFGAAHRRLPLGTSALAATAAGLALGTKFTMIGPTILLGLGSVLLLGRGQRVRHAAAWAGGLIVLGGYWYLRNAVAVGNPLPALKIHFGPLSLPSPAQPATYTVWEYLTNRAIWSRIFVPGLRESLGLGWWALIAGTLAGAVLALVNRRDPRLALVGGLALVSGFLFLVTPQLLGLPGDPVFFFANVRYAAVPLTLGLILLALAPLLAGARGTLAWLAATALALVFTALDPGVWPSGIAVRRFAPELHGGPALAGAAIGAAILVAGEVWLSRGPWRRDRACRDPARSSVALVTSAVVASAVVVFAGWRVSDSYAHDRYRNTQSLPTLYAWARHIHHARIGIIGFTEQYPFSGLDDSNRVQFIGVGRPHEGFATPTSCQQWRAAVNRGHYDFVVVTPAFFSAVDHVPELRWTQSSSNAHAILRQNVNHVTLGVLFRITGPLDPATCPR